MTVNKWENGDSVLFKITGIQTVGELKKLLDNVPDDLNIDVNGAYGTIIYIINIKDAETTVSFADEDCIEVEDYIDTYNLKSVE